MVALLGFAMVFVFMFLIMTKRMSALSSININSNYFRINWWILCKYGSYDVRRY